jgi:DNA replication protein DnaC
MDQAAVLDGMCFDLLPCCQDCRAAPEVDVGRAENVVLIGGLGRGKSHVATALGIQAIEHHRKRVRFFSTVELVNALEQEKAQGKAGKIAEALVKTDLVVLDELGYLPFSASGGTAGRSDGGFHQRAS